MNEADHKARLVKQINSAGGWAERWEDKYRPGILDLVLKLPLDPSVVFAEGKLIKGNLFAPSELQWIKGQKMKTAGIEVLLIGWKNADHRMYISPWVEKANIKDCYGSSWLVKSYLHILQEYLFRWGNLEEYREYTTDQRQ
jgi:hypothetical protein